MADVFQPSVRKREAPYRGPMSSRDYNALQDEIVADMSRVARVLNSLSASVKLKNLELEEERRKLLAYAEDRRTQKKRDDYRRAVNGETITYWQTFRDLEGLSYTGVSAARRLRVEPAFGQAMLPWNQAVSRFATKNPDTDELFKPSTLKVTVTAVDEGSGDVKAGTPELAVDGLSAEPWIRKVLFPLEDDQDSVTMDVDIDVPSNFAADANLLTIVPSPAGEVDIVNVTYSTTQAAPSTALPGFVEVRNASAYRLHFAPLGITKLRIRLRQRHFVIEEAEKAFLYGLKEVGLYLVELDRTNGQPTIQNNNIAIFKVEAPAGYKFDKIKAFVSDPAMSVSDKIYYRIYKEEGLTTKLFDSATDSAPTNSSPLSVVSHNATSLWVVLYLEYQTANKVSPVVSSFYMDYSVIV